MTKVTKKGFEGYSYEHEGVKEKVDVGDLKPKVGTVTEFSVSGED